jgi:hypothetical protein
MVNLIMIEFVALGRFAATTLTSAENKGIFHETYILLAGRRFCHVAPAFFVRGVLVFRRADGARGQESIQIRNAIADAPTNLDVRQTVAPGGGPYGQGLGLDAEICGRYVAVNGG